MSAGAVIIHDNLLLDPRFDSITHPSGALWSDTQYLLTPQLQPKATHAQGLAGQVTRMDVNFSAPVGRRGDHAMVLAGTDIPDVGLDRMVRIQYGLGGSFTGTAIFDPHLIRHVDGSWHMVFLTDRGETADFDTIRVTWDASVAGAVGGVYPGRYRQAPELADRGWEILGPDDNTSSKAAGGQIYKAHASPQINRELRVPMGLVRSQAAVGSPVSQRRVALPSPVVSGTSLIQTGDGFVYTSVSTSNGTVTFSDILEKLGGEYARVDYSAHFRGSSSTGTINPFRWSIDDHELLNGPLRGARGSAIIRINSDDLVLRAETGNASNQHAIRVDRVSLIPAPDNFQWGPDDSLLGIFMRHGTSRPVFVMQRPSDPIINEATGMYGYIQGVPGVTHRRGAYFQSRLVVGEQR